MAETPERGIGVPGVRAVRAKKPSVRYGQKAVNLIRTGLECGKSLNQICHEDGAPSYTAVNKWRRRYPEFNAVVAVARQAGAEALVDEVLDAARAVTPETIGTTKVRMQGTKWVAGRNSPLRYGDRAGTAAPKGAVVMHIRVRRFEKLYDDEGRAFLREILLEGEQ